MNSFGGALIVFILLYFLPGFSFSRLFEGRTKNSPFFILFLSFLFLPLEYILLVSFHRLSLIVFVFLGLVLLVVGFGLNRGRILAPKIDLENLFPSFKPSPILWLSAAVFTLLVLGPRIGLWQGYFPVGDDQHQIRKIVSIAESPDAPLFYHFPTTKLTIYYFNNVAPGLWVKFTQNFVPANQAWFIHVLLQTILILWLIIRLGGSLFNSQLSRYIFFFGLTFFSGFEFFIYLFKRPGFVNQLEWWSDWFWPQSQIHMQISNPLTLFFWVPQHLMAALFVLVIFIFLGSQQKSKPLSQFFLGVLWANILGNSAFIFLSAVLVYGLHQIREIIRQRNFWEAARFNLWVIFWALVFSVSNLVLFLTAEKGHYLVPMANVFWFADNSLWWGKLVNFSLTVPFYFLVEFGLLSLVMIYAIFKFFKDPEFRNRYLFFYLFVFLLPVIFVVKALDDNNISMRSFIPAQIALTIFAAELLGRMRFSRMSFLFLFFGMLISLPSGFFDLNLRFREQFSGVSESERAFYRALDRSLPPSSIVLVPYGMVDKVTALGHRLSFKDPNLFSATDKEHTAASQVGRFSGLDFESGQGLERLIEEVPSLFNNYQFYSLSNVGGPKVKPSRFVFGQKGEFSIYSLQIEP